MILEAQEEVEVEEVLIILLAVIEEDAVEEAIAEVEDQISEVAIREEIQIEILMKIQILKRKIRAVISARVDTKEKEEEDIEKEIPIVQKEEDIEVAEDRFEEMIEVVSGEEAVVGVEVADTEEEEEAKILAILKEMKEAIEKRRDLEEDQRAIPLLEGEEEIPEVMVLVLAEKIRIMALV
jgi:hypothetical protein